MKLLSRTDNTDILIVLVNFGRYMSLMKFRILCMILESSLLFYKFWDIDVLNEPIR